MHIPGTPRLVSVVLNLIACSESPQVELVNGILVLIVGLVRSLKVHSMIKYSLSAISLQPPIVVSSSSLAFLTIVLLSIFTEGVPLSSPSSLKTIVSPSTLTEIVLPVISIPLPPYTVVSPGSPLGPIGPCGP